MRSLTTGLGHIVAVGETGEILSAPLGGGEFVPRDFDPSLMPRTVTFTQDRFLLFGGTYVAVSTDATNWTLVETTLPAGPVDGVLFTADGRYLAVGSGFDGVMISSDGTNWDLQGGADVVGASIATDGNGRFVTVAGNTTCISQDGTNWTRTVHEEEQPSLNTVAFGNGRFVVMGDSGVFAVSANGKDWTFASLGSDLSMQQMRWAAGQFIAVGYGSPFGLFPDGVILTSPDGHEWSYRYHPAYRAGFYAIAASTEPVFVAGHGGTILESAPVDIGPPRLSIHLHAAGGVELTLNGHVGRSYRVDSCSGLATCQELRFVSTFRKLGGYRLDQRARTFLPGSAPALNDCARR